LVHAPSNFPIIFSNSEIIELYIYRSLEGSVAIWLKELFFEEEVVKNISVSLIPTLNINERVEHYI